MRFTPSTSLSPKIVAPVLSILLSTALLFVALANPGSATAEAPSNQPETPTPTHTPTLPPNPVGLGVGQSTQHDILIPETYSQSTANQPSSAPRTETVLAALVDFHDVTPAQRPFTRSDIVNLLSDNPNSLKSFILATSRGKVNADFHVLDWISVSDHQLGNGDVPQDAVSAMSYHADLSQYDKVMPFIFHPEGGPGCQAYLGPVTWDTPNGQFELGAAWLSGQDMWCVWNGRIAHEYGHTFGFWHSLSIDCIKSNLIPGSLIDPLDENDGCDGSITLNSDVDMMGDDLPRTYESFFPLHFQAAWQARAGWITANQVIVAQTSGEYRLTTLESLTPEPKAIKIPVGNDHMENPHYYWLELRDYDNDECRVDVRLQANAISQGSQRME